MSRRHYDPFETAVVHTQPPTSARDNARGGTSLATGSDSADGTYTPPVLAPRSASSRTPTSSPQSSARGYAASSIEILDYSTARAQQRGGSHAGAMAGGTSIAAQNLYRNAALNNSEHVRTSVAPKKSTGGIVTGPASRPQLLVCYLCGQQFGTNSLHIHQPQCYIKKVIQWERGNVVTRGPKPMSPEEHTEQLAKYNGGGGGSPLAGRGKYDVAAFNEAQFQAFTEKALVPCDVCGRTFLPDRLEVHMRSCRPGHSARPVGRRTTPTPNVSQAASPTDDDTATGRSRPGSFRGHEGNASSPNNGADELSPGFHAPPPPSRPSLDELRMARRRGDLGNSGSFSSGRLGTPTPAEADETQAPNAAPGTASRHASGDRRESPPAGAAVDDALVGPVKTATTALKPRSSPSPTASRPATSSGPPRLSLAARAQADLIACTYCGRNFSSDRVARHEEVCIERKTIKAAVATAGAAPTAPTTRTKDGLKTPRGSAGHHPPTATRESPPPQRLSDGPAPSAKGHGRPSAATSSVSGAPRLLFCTSCGAKLPTEGLPMKFCGQCGCRLSA